ncbi:MAG TPA: antibiotic biosynthesis monooxygenase [Candidatus Limnocylindrales bacterium]|nr:antibiotic biosynthesis monooxygenase [Candidatus Limnocylindrales bacterium]
MTTLLRVYRARIRPGKEEQAMEFARQTARRRAASRPGLVSIHVGRRLGDDGREELIAVTIWQDLQALQSAVGADWEEPYFVPGLTDILEDATVDHFEAMSDIEEALAPTGAGRR